MFYSADFSEDFKPGHSISDNTEKLLQRGKVGERGARIYRSFCSKRPRSRNVKRLLLIKGNQISQVKEFSAFLCMGRCKSLGSLKSYLWYAPQLSGVSILSFLILSFLRVHRWGWLRWLPGRWTWQWAAHLSPSWVPSGLTVWVAVMWWLDGCNVLCLLVWQAIF